jgi:hypothetical protein
MALCLVDSWTNSRAVLLMVMEADALLDRRNPQHNDRLCQ